ncbi:MAG TPA: AI-2E family transporter [Ignavibacteriaceae bacterium]|nr:AI-2E family transporter [Ignavibacteriaceae bacterium]
MDKTNNYLPKGLGSQSAIRFLVIVAALVIIIAGINLAQSVIVLSLVSVFLALIGTPPVIWLEQKRMPSFIAVIIVISVMVIILLLIGVLVGASLKSFSSALPFYQTRIQEQITAFEALLTSKGITGSDKVLVKYFNPESVMNLTAIFLTGLSSALSNVVLILLTVTFILLEVSSFPVKLRAVLGNPEAVFPLFTKFVIDIRRYLVITTLINLAAGILIGIWLSILGVKYPVLWGFLVFLLHFIPNIGSVIAAIPAVLLALIQLGIGSAIFVAAGYLLVGFIVGNIIQPKLMGQRLGLSTLVVFLSMIFWGSLLGLIGAILCIPLTMTLKFAFESREDTQWIAVLLGPEKSVVEKSSVSWNLPLIKKRKRKVYEKNKN